MILIRSGWVVLAATAIVWLGSTWGAAVLTYLFGWWASYVIFGGLRHGVVIRGIRNPLSGFGEDPAPRADEKEEQRGR